MRGGHRPVTPGRSFWTNSQYSTRLTHVMMKHEVNGLLASGHNSMADSQVAWNLTQTSLDSAEFPLDQLLDYLPDTANSWIYQPGEWNNSWSVNCETTEATVADLTFTANCSSFQSKFGPSLPKIFPQALYGDYFYYSSGDYYLNSTYIKDLLVIMYAANYTDFEELTWTWRTINISIGALHVHGVPKNDSQFGSACRYGEGGVDRALYTRIDCQVKRDRGTFGTSFLGAFPDAEDVDGIPSGFIGNFYTRFKQESMEDLDVSIITPRDLQRFYQVYMITKDTQTKQPVRRQMSVKVITVQLSTGFIAVFALLILFNGLGGIAYGLLMLQNHEAMASVPQSKLDWLMQSIIARTPVPRSLGYQLPMPSTPAGPQSEQIWPLKADLKRAQLEGAVYDTTRAWYTQSSPDVTPSSPEFPNKVVEPRHLSTFWVAGSQQVSRA